MASLAVKDILKRVTRALQDPDAERWSLEEHLDAINDALLDICFYKPSACSETVILEMAEGTLQTLGEGQSQLIRVTRNITSAEVDEPPVVGGVAVTSIERDSLDRQMPDWHDPNVVPQSATVLHVMTDPMSPDTFYVYPGNDGNGRIEAVVAVEPDEIETPASPDTLSSYDGLEVPLGRVFKSAIIDYVLYRAYAKDMQFAGAAQRAVAHFQNFNSALGVRRQLEAVANPENS